MIEMRSVGPEMHGLKLKSHGLRTLPVSRDAAIDLSLLSGIVSGLLVAAYTEWSPWAGFAVGGIAMAFLTALVHTLHRRRLRNEIAAYKRVT